MIYGRQIGLNLLDDLAYFTDCQIATYEGLALRKSSPKSELERQRNICEKMVESCRAHKVPDAKLASLKDRFESARKHDRSLTPKENANA